MAKYLISTPAFVDNRYIQASPANPLVETFGDDVAPSRSWKPMDKAAQAQLLKLGVKAEIVKSAPEPEVEKVEGGTMADINKRISDRSPV